MKTTASSTLEAALRYAQQHGLEATAEKFPSLGEIQYAECAGRQCAYLNSGETYEDTVCEENGEFWIGSWGAWYESAEAEHCEDTDEIRCGYCSEFTPIDESGEWHRTRCESCGHNVSTGQPMPEPSRDDDDDDDDDDRPIISQDVAYELLAALRALVAYADRYSDAMRVRGFGAEELGEGAQSTGVGPMAHRAIALAEKGGAE